MHVWIGIWVLFFNLMSKIERPVAGAYIDRKTWQNRKRRLNNIYTLYNILDS